MTTVDPERTARRLVSALDRHDLDEAVATLDPTFKMEEPAVSGEPLRGQDAYRGLWSSVYRAFPDARLRITSLVVAGDRLAAEVEMTGTFKGEFGSPPQSLAPTGQRVVVHWAAFGRVGSTGPLVEARIYNPGFAQQLERRE